MPFEARAELEINWIVNQLNLAERFKQLVPIKSHEIVNSKCHVCTASNVS